MVTMASDTDTSGRDTDSGPGPNWIRAIIEEDLRTGKHDRVVTRFPPEPNGPLQLGSAMAVAIDYGMAREFGPRGLHVAHVIIDGVINGDRVNERFPQFKEQRGEDGMLGPDSIAAAYWGLHRQEPTAWTLELDLRPYKEPF